MTPLGLSSTARFVSHCREQVVLSLGPGLGPGHGWMGCMVVYGTFHSAPEQGQGPTPIVPHCSDPSPGHSQCNYTALRFMFRFFQQVYLVTYVEVLIYIVCCTESLLFVSQWLRLIHTKRQSESEHVVWMIPGYCYHYHNHRTMSQHIQIISITVGYFSEGRFLSWSDMTIVYCRMVQDFCISLKVLYTYLCMSYCCQILGYSRCAKYCSIL